MIRRYIHWIIAVFLLTAVVGACVVRTRPAPQRGRPVYVQPDKHKHHHHDKHKHKHNKHRH